MPASYAAGGLGRGGGPKVAFSGQVPSPDVFQPAAGLRFGKDKSVDDDIYELMLRLPKTSLHVHLGGSTPLSVIKQALIPELGVQHPKLEREKLRDAYRIMRHAEYQRQINRTDLHDDGDRTESLPENGLARYMQAYSKLPELAKSMPFIYKAAHEYTKNSAADNVRYFELRTNPMPKKGGTAEEMIHAIQKGVEDAQAELDHDHKKIDYGILLLAYRHGDEAVNPETGRKNKVDEAIKVAEVAIDLRKKGYPIAGIDLAGAEATCPVTDFSDYFQVIRDYNATAKPEERLGITIHAGETHDSGDLTGVESVREAIRLAWDENTPVRIGHGVQAAKDPELLAEIREKNIGLEMCPKSNVQTEAVDWYTEHPALALSRAGVAVSISTDNETVSATTPTNEFVKLFRYADRQGERTLHNDRKRMVMAGLETAFIHDPKKRAEIIADVDKTFAQIERDPEMRIAMYKEQHEGETVSLAQDWFIRVSCFMENIQFVTQEFIAKLKKLLTLSPL